MGLVAVLGDIHGNREALDAILKSIQVRNEKAESDKKIEYFICTGDVVGYGPDPKYCLQKVFELAKAGKWFVVAGNHDLAVRDKLERPELVIAESVGMSGNGAYEGVHLAARQLCGDAARIPLENKPARPELRDDAAVEQYKLALYEWRSKQVEPQTQKAIKEGSSAGKEQTLLRDATRSLFVDSRVDVPLLSRLKSGADLARAAYQEGLEQSSVDELRANQLYVSRIIEARENELLRKYLGNLQPEVRADVPAGAGSVKLLLVHDNPFKPGDAEYLVDKERYRKMKRRGDTHVIDDVFDQWAEKWPDVQVIAFGHSHFDGVYARDGRLIINPGTVGIPRGNELEATYAVWNPEAQGRDSVEIVRIKRAGWRMTREKMRQYGLPDKFEHIHAEVV